MATTDIVQRVKTLLYGHGLGEKPTVVLAPAAANETSIGTTVVFDLATAELAKVNAGDVLSVLGAATAPAAYMMYVMSKDSTSVTALASYMGSPAVTADGDLDGVVFELGSLKSEWFIYQAVESVFNTLLYPQIYKYGTYTIAPDLVTYQVELNAAVMEIQNAFQIIATETHQIPFGIARNVSTSISSTTVLGELYAIDGSSVYVTTKERYLEADSISEALTECIATGAAALAIGASRSSTDLESSNKDSQVRGQRNPANDLWRDFITLRTALSDDLASQVDWFEIRRG
jgi:hypothetical protein